MNEWITGNRYLNQAEMENNATLVYQYLGARGFTVNAVAGILGNMQTESHINPGIWQSLTVGTGGYGLVQWTPYTKYSKWAGSGWQNNGDMECKRIVWEFNNNQQYIKTSAYPLTAAEFMASTDSPYNLGMAFLHNYERPKDPNQPARGTQAEAWYEFLTGQTPPTPVNPEDPGYHKPHQIPVWLLFKFKGKFKGR